MKFEVNFEKKFLLSGVNTVMGAIPKNPTIGILKCILIETIDTNQVRITANNMDIGISTKVSAEVIETGKIAVPADLFKALIKSMPDESKINIKLDKNQVKITSNNAKFKIMAENVETFVSLPEVQTGQKMTVKQHEFKAAIEKTIFALMPESIDMRLASVQLKYPAENGQVDKMQMVALDGRRIAFRSLKITGNDPFEVLIPGIAMNEIRKNMASTEEEAVFVISDTHAICEMGDTKIITRVVTKEFFGIKNMLNLSDYPITVKLNRKEFLDIISRSMILINEGNQKPIIFNYLKKADSESVVSINIRTNLGEMDDEVNCYELTGISDFKIAFAPRYYIEALKAIEDDEIQIFMINSKAPSVIAGEDYFYVILPVNIGG